MFDDGMPYEDPYKGWNRASIQFRSRKPYKPNIRAEDLVMPNGLGNLRMFGMCVAMALMMTVLYVWVPLYMVHFFVPMTGVWYSGAVGCAFVGLTALLYFGGARETRRDRELAARL
jgi:hypothetical protein